MRSCRSIQKTVAVMVIIAFGMLSLFVAPVQAAMVGTADILQAQETTLARQQVQAFMERKDVAHQLQAWGVSPKEAKLRVAAMTDVEVLDLASRIEQVPVGGDAVSAIILVSLLGFIALIVTDLLGYTDVFTFIKKR